MSDWGSIEGVPFIGVTMGLSGPAGGERASINSAYVDSVQRAGGVPVPIPPSLSGTALDELLGNLDGLLLTGGGDIDPALYQEPVHPKAAYISRARDDYELAVIRWAIGQRKPVLAVCRGMQILNVSLGGSLHQHLPDNYGDQVCHQQTDAGHERGEPTHAVDVRAGTLLANLIGSGVVMVNSMHHQAIRAAGGHVVITGRAPDGVVEAIECPSLGDFVVGVQWHPEEMAANNPQAHVLFTSLVDVAAGRPIVEQPLHVVRV